VFEVHISGQARLAARFDGEHLLCLEAGTELVQKRSVYEFEALFADAGDLRVEQCKGWPDAARALNRRVDEDDALVLSLIVLDRDADQDARRDAVRLIEPLLRDTRTCLFLLRRLCAAPLPGNASPLDELVFARSSVRVWDLLVALFGLQSSVKRVCEAWDAIPESCFSGLLNRTELRNRFRDEGCFYDLARGVIPIVEGDLTQELILAWLTNALPDSAGPHQLPLPEMESINNSHVKLHRARKRLADHVSLTKPTL
jgi:hypothetical protein